MDNVDISNVKSFRDPDKDETKLIKTIENIIVKQNKQFYEMCYHCFASILFIDLFFILYSLFSRNISYRTLLGCMFIFALSLFALIFIMSEIKTYVYSGRKYRVLDCSVNDVKKIKVGQLVIGNGILTGGHKKVSVKLRNNRILKDYYYLDDESIEQFEDGEKVETWLFKSNDEVIYQLVSKYKPERYKKIK